MQPKELKNYLLEQFSPLVEVTSRPMMGGYIFYYRGKIFGGIYEAGFMVKITKASKKHMIGAKEIPPYKGGKLMILVDDIDDKDKLCNMVLEMYDELPQPKSKNKKQMN